VGTALRVLSALAGITLVFATLASAVRATILPRGVHDPLTSATTLVVRVLFRLRAGHMASYERRDRIMAMLAPTALMVLLTTWLLLLFSGYTLIYLAVATHSFERALELSGSSVFTLGTTGSNHFRADLVTYTEAAFGLLTLTLMITYLPSIYTAFSRREAGVSLLRVRAGDPPRAATTLIRYHRIEAVQYRLTELWRTWETWFVDIEETHTTFPILAFFRSPQPEQSWITAAGAVLDTASFWVAAVEHPADPDAQLCIRAGFQTLQRIAQVFRIPYDADPAADGPITIGRDEWDHEMREMAEAGVPLLPDWDQSWRDWKGWRVNYDTVLLNLARLVEAPPAPWLSDRSPLALESRWTLARDVRSRAQLPTTRARRGRRPA
jgi:hypothetical protein